MKKNLVIRLLHPTVLKILKHRNMYLQNMVVDHDIQHRTFLIKLYGGAAKLKYNITAENAIDIIYTYVPEKNRGKGIATRLVSYVLEYAHGQNMNIQTTCPFAEAYVEKHPEYAHRIHQLS